MILIKYTSIRKQTILPKTIGSSKEDRHPNAADRSRAIQFKVSPEEFIRRDNIIRQMYLDCYFNIGDVCEPVGIIAREMYGKCIIRKIFRTYHDFPTAQAIDWPADDKPLIVTAEPERKPEDSNMILCTPKFLQKHYAHTTICS
jgi:hypothetical protein